MPRVSYIRSEVQKVEAGSLNHRILLHIRDIQPPTFSAGDIGVEFSEQFTPKAEVPIGLWAAIKPYKGLMVFDGVNKKERLPTHEFYVRWMPNVTYPLWIEYQGNYYDIVSVINVSEESKFLLLLAEFRGDKTRLASNT